MKLSPTDLLLMAAMAAITITLLKWMRQRPPADGARICPMCGSDEITPMRHYATFALPECFICRAMNADTNGTTRNTPMNNPWYYIFVRPPGSSIWSQHMKPGICVPWTSSSPLEANAEAMTIVDTTNYCARVVTVEHPAPVDQNQYALLADGDTTYVKTP